MKVSQTNTSVSLIFCFNTSPWSSSLRSRGTHGRCPASLLPAPHTVPVPLRQDEPREPADADVALDLWDSWKAHSLQMPSTASSPVAFFSARNGSNFPLFLAQLTKWGFSSPVQGGFPWGQGGWAACTRTIPVPVRLQSPLLMLWQNRGIFFWLSPTIKKRELPYDLRKSRPS